MRARRGALAVAIAASLMLGAGAQTPQPARGTASIGGSVVSGDTGRPVASATLTLVPADTGAQRTVRTNSTGIFEFSGLAAGRYQLSLIASGILTVPFGVREIGDPNDHGTFIELTDGQRFDRADFVVPRLSTIEGTIIDEFGDPVPDTVLLLSRKIFGIGGQGLMVVASSLPTDDKGRFRIGNVAPSDYYLSTGSVGDGNASNGFALTFYPGAATVATARIVRVASGQDAQLSFALLPARTARVSGVVLGPNGTPTAARVELRRRGMMADGPLGSTRTATGMDGSFSIRNVPSGRYALQASGFRESGTFAPVANLDLEIDGVDVTGLRISLSMGATARGKIVFEGTRGPLPSPADVQIGLLPMDVESAVSAGRSQANADWTFSVEGNFDRRLLLATVRQSGWMLQRVTLGGRDITDEPLDFSNGNIAGLEVAFTNSAPVVAGTVADRAGAVPLTYTVLVYSADRSKRGLLSRYLQSARRNSEGRFRTSGLPPGDYLAVALPIVTGPDSMDPAWLERLEAVATRITLVDGEVKTLQLAVSPVPPRP